MLAFQGHQGRPSVLQGAKKHIQDQFDDAVFSGCEQAAWWQLFHPFAVAPKKTVQRTEHHVGVDDHHRKAAQGVHAHQVHRQGRLELFEVVAVLDDLHPCGVDPRAGAQHFEQSKPEHADEALIDHVDR